MHPVVRRINSTSVYLGWRFVPEKNDESLFGKKTKIGFNVHRTDGEKTVQVNDTPITTSTNFIDNSAPETGPFSYFVSQVENGQVTRRSETVRLPHGPDASKPYLSFDLKGNGSVKRAGFADLNGDGQHEFVLKRPGSSIDPAPHLWKPSEGTYRLEAYRLNGQRLWQYDLGWAIERGTWYAPYVVYDFDGDGRGEVVTKTGEGDPRGPDGRVESGPEYLSVIDGRTGKEVARTDWIPREPFYRRHNDRRAYNYASRNQIGVAYLDGKHPFIIMMRGTYDAIFIEAYYFDGSTLNPVWKWDNVNAQGKYRGGSHWIQSGDVDQDEREEIVIGSMVVDHNGEALWEARLGGPDHQFLGEILPLNEGLEIYFGIEDRTGENGMCLVDANTGKVLWGSDERTGHVHGQGMCSDISSRHPGRECYSRDIGRDDSKKKSRLWNAAGKVLSSENKWGTGTWTVWWEADAQREIIGEKIHEFQGSTYDVRPEGDLLGVADIFGDWREEIITDPGGEIRIYTTTIPSRNRLMSPMVDSLYRTDVAHQTMGYHQPPMTSRLLKDFTK